MFRRAAYINGSCRTGGDSRSDHHPRHSHNANGHHRSSTVYDDDHHPRHSRNANDDLHHVGCRAGVTSRIRMVDPG
ncbi:MAG: hypothetical protein OXS33_01890 [bacterium]|nr:hypothetical protein [bacterium]